MEIFVKPDRILEWFYLRSIKIMENFAKHDHTVGKISVISVDFSVFFTKLL